MANSLGLRCSIHYMEGPISHMSTWPSEVQALDNAINLLIELTLIDSSSFITIACFSLDFDLVFEPFIGFKKTESQTPYTRHVCPLATVVNGGTTTASWLPSNEATRICINYIINRIFNLTVSRMKFFRSTIREGAATTVTFDFYGSQLSMGGPNNSLSGLLHASNVLNILNSTMGPNYDNPNHWNWIVSSPLVAYIFKIYFNKSCPTKRLSTFPLSGAYTIPVVGCVKLHRWTHLLRIYTLKIAFYPLKWKTSSIKIIDKLLPKRITLYVKLNS